MLAVRLSRQQSGEFVRVYDDDRSAVQLVLVRRVGGQVSATSSDRRGTSCCRLTTVLVAEPAVVGPGARVGAAVQVDGRVVGQEAERLEAKRHQRVVDWIERQRPFHRAPAGHS